MYDWEEEYITGYGEEVDTKEDEEKGIDTVGEASRQKSRRAP